MRRDNFIVPADGFRIRSRGRLPHWQLDNAIYSVTFRLRDSLPPAVLRSLLREHRHLVRTASPSEMLALERQFALRLDSFLDAGYGGCVLKNPVNASIVASALHHFHRQRYWLHAWCVMPNHVHVLFRLDRGQDLEKVLHSWKSYSAHEIGGGVIWEREYFDRIVRDARDYRETRRYILENPGKAGLLGWRWAGSMGDEDIW